MRQITKKDIASMRRRRVWDLGNRVLYDLCQSHPEHTRDDEIVAKIWLIGRSYAASIERRKNAMGGNGDNFYESVVAPAMRESNIDSWLSSIPMTDECGGAKSIEVHKMLLDLFHSITDLEKRSLASKYLHFHKPKAFFIYDSRARHSITKVVPRLNQISAIAADSFDPEYRDFVRRCVWLRNHIHKTLKETLAPREIDKLLLMIADGEI
jgi:hypothetical protein